MLRKNHELLLGEYNGWLEVFNMNIGTITHTRLIREDATIWDILAVDETHFLLASSHGILKITKD